MLLKDIGSIRPGYHLRGKLRPLPEGNMGIIQMSDVGADGSIDYKEINRISVDEVKTDYLIEIGDLLIVNRGLRNTSAVVTQRLKDTVAASHFFWVRPESPAVSSSYLAWYLNQQSTQEYLSRFRKTSSIPLLSREGLGNLAIPTPPLKIQERIAAAGFLAKRETEILEELADRRFKLVSAQLLTTVSKYENGERNV